MRIVKIYNNNAVETKDTDCREIIVAGCGLALKKGWGTRLMILILSISVDTFFTRISIPKLQHPEIHNISVV